ncbi:hypothetical protein CEK71_02040 [Methylovulum psychrotolerans]|jgi:uncharacterized protein (DUF1499 family)|uniref:DUF1499 domain-containing protein n=2 Tax=Methylovulum psychrotolerans TaxID=1704499 RepID=A0A1Z4BUM2_9GAMM|nr:hypothetical protein CEK71_02040 [Methylovulum psychrotolerans]MBT9098257.1 DUF1499 domain-containing protein [Methylovulum psychrotolerans]POZ53967.1 hypothetical protein AADEFJLK_01009 [Methylovulum psychrotolerans]
MHFKIIFFSVIMAMTNPTLTQASAIDGKLPLCGSSPNCVSSQADIHDRQHYILPFEIKGNPLQAWDALKKAILKQPRLVITHETHTTLHAEATSLVFRFVDDINVLLDADRELIHIRSASRVGHSDFGVNRKRIEGLRAELRKMGVVD